MSNNITTITTEELAQLDSTVASVEYFRLLGWSLNTHYMEIMRGMKSHLFSKHKMVAEEGEEGIEKAILSLAPELR